MSNKVSNPNNVDEGRWEWIKRLIKVDPNLHQDKLMNFGKF